MASVAGRTVFADEAHHISLLAPPWTCREVGYPVVIGGSADLEHAALKAATHRTPQREARPKAARCRSPTGLPKARRLVIRISSINE
jgi:hypothetical protein